MSKQPLEDQQTGVHRARLWEIAFYALNNTSTNAYMILVASISYFLVGIVGVGQSLQEVSSPLCVSGTASQIRLSE